MRACILAAGLLACAQLISAQNPTPLAMPTDGPACVAAVAAIPTTLPPCHSNGAPSTECCGATTPGSLSLVDSIMQACGGPGVNVLSVVDFVLTNEYPVTYLSPASAQQFIDMLGACPRTVDPSCSSVMDQFYSQCGATAAINPIATTIEACCALAPAVVNQCVGGMESQTNSFFRDLFNATEAFGCGLFPQQLCNDAVASTSRCISSQPDGTNSSTVLDNCCGQADTFCKGNNGTAAVDFVYAMSTVVPPSISPSNLMSVLEQCGNRGGNGGSNNGGGSGGSNNGGGGYGQCNPSSFVTKLYGSSSGPVTRDASIAVVNGNGYPALAFMDGYDQAWYYVDSTKVNMAGLSPVAPGCYTAGFLPVPGVGY